MRSLQMMQNAPGGGRAFARCHGEGERHDVQNGMMMAAQLDDGTWLTEGTKGKLSPGAVVQVWRVASLPAVLH